MNLVLLLGRNDDPHIRSIGKNLTKLGWKYFVLDKLSANDKLIISFYGMSQEFELNIRARRINMDEVTSIWNSYPIQILIDSKLSKDTHEFIFSEWKEALYSLINYNNKWVNNPYCISNSFNRLKQLNVANRIGLRVPYTLITNDRTAFFKFFRECNKSIIAKTLHSSKGIPKGKMIFSVKIEDPDLDVTRNLKFAPCMFQEYIKKETEFRVTIVGKTIHATEIFSQNSKKTLHDWRHYNGFPKIPYTASKLPAKVQQKLLQLNKIMGLEFCTVDLIRTPDEKFFFLELNAQGKWLWIQRLTGINISKNIAEYLIL